MDKDLDEVFFLIDVGRHPERVDDIDRKTALLCYRHVIEEACAVKISAEAPGVLQEDDVCPPAPARHDGHILLGPDQPLDIPGGHQGEVSHDDERRAAELPECPVDRLVQGLVSDGDECILMAEGVRAEQCSATP